MKEDAGITNDILPADPGLIAFWRYCFGSEMAGKQRRWGFVSNQKLPHFSQIKPDLVLLYKVVQRSYPPGNLRDTVVLCHSLSPTVSDFVLWGRNTGQNIWRLKYIYIFFFLMVLFDIWIFFSLSLRK